MTTQLPWENDTTRRWYSVYDFAQKWRRSPRCIRRWCADGTLTKWGCSLYRDPTNHWWIGEPLTRPADITELTATPLAM